jgi:hypothetical protein
VPDGETQEVDVRDFLVAGDLARVEEPLVKE